MISDDLEPLPPRVRRGLSLIGIIVGVVTLGCLLYASADVALAIGWHPFPETAIGCSLHKKFHSWKTHVQPERVIAHADCLDITLFEREIVITDSHRIDALRSWLTERPDFWGERVGPFDATPGWPSLTVRDCTERADSGQKMLGNQDWIAVSGGLGQWHPICRDEWRALVALVSAP
jgi:hypothetical protein